MSAPRALPDHLRTPHGAKASEVYGIVGYLLSLITFVVWILWAYTPDWVLESLSITYYPNRYWAIALPMYGMCLVIYLIIIYNAWNLCNTYPFDSVYTIQGALPLLPCRAVPPRFSASILRAAFRRSFLP